MKEIIKNSIIIYLKGLLMGSADIVPGVSGGTMALITRIYTRLIDGITHIFALLNKDNMLDILNGRMKKIWETFCSIDFALFIPLLLGIGTAFLVLSNGIHYMMENFTVQTYAFFFGLILASAYFLYRQLEKMGLKVFVMILMGALCGFVIVGLETLKVNHSLLIVFLSGSIAITAMILPGISGAFILVMFNQYEYMLNVLRTLALKEIIIFMVGAVLGLALFSRVISYLIHRFRSLTMGFLIGLMLGSLRLQYTIINGVEMTKSMFAWVIISALIGFALVLIVTKMAKK